ncbi:4Fe-4S binding protein [Thiolapillus sp.]|uniref:4Fe-4S binding protein n=2 Tax=Thiolapillus sp. TaxID=2017437 RepID=UPI003AF9C5FB
MQQKEAYFQWGGEISGLGGRIRKWLGLAKPVTDGELARWSELVYQNCTLCGRCSMVCPVGNDISVPQQAAGEMRDYGPSSSACRVSAPESTPFFRTPSATDFLLSHHNAGECHGPDRQY